MDSQETTPSPSGHPSFDCGQRPMPQQKALEPITSITPSKGSKVSRYLNGRIKPTFYAECQLILLTFCIGLQDAVSFPDFHCFASNQTGNTVFLVLAIVLPEMNGDMFVTANIGVALGFFLAAAWLTGQLGHIIGPRRRLYLLVCNAVQTALVFAAAAVQYVQHASGGELHLSGPRTLVAIGLLASAAGSQVVLSRALAMTEITTAMATAAWVDLVIDPGLVRGLTKNRPRNRRVAFLTALVLGTLAGAFIYKRVGSPAALVVSGVGKAVVTGMFFWSPQEEEEGGEGGIKGGKGEDAEKGREGV
ncbi:hypothetical protein B0T18DRAFT_325235 [Schizothecium vesticola]|uniref:DUF1275 domain protein n=1 Tax=Schizothecium vesticola TaxID=314040 RepID=A0AA40EV16_9PEZI|nr:hypothetical protein B0T18DRAFT_325235 [Schizothecium vesticola]